MTPEAYFYSKITDCIKENKKENAIFVVQGINEGCLNKFDNAVIVDRDTFMSDNHADFDKAWFADFFTALNSPKDYHLISYAQLAYLFSYIDSSFFLDRLIIIKDNLRQLYPLKKELYFEKLENENIEKRSENMPLHHAEQFKIDGKYYYALNWVSHKIPTVDLHQDELTLELRDHMENGEVIDISDLHELDVFFNQFIEAPGASTAFIKFHKSNLQTGR